MSDTRLTLWGFQFQTPIKRALEQQLKETAARLEEAYPAIGAKATTEGAALYFFDKTMIKEDSLRSRGDTPKPRHPPAKNPIGGTHSR